MRCYQLVGVPGSGKSTWLDKQDWKKNCVYVSTDYYVEKFAKRMNKTYSEVFNDVMPRAIRLMMRRVRLAQSKQLDIVWDQTNTTVSSRKRKFIALPEYDHIAIVFKTPDIKELDRRIRNRPGKTIPKAVMWDMIVQLSDPTEDEGFKEIWYAQ
jgi:predicted kinase